MFIGVFNREQTLREAIDSVLSQSLRDFELLLIDDASTDASLTIARSYADRRIRIESNPRNLGNTANRNRGIDLARGKYLAVLDSDDVALPGRLAAQVAYLDSHPRCAAVGSWVESRDVSGHRLRIVRHPTTSDQIKAWLPWRCPLTHTALMMRTQLAKRHRYDERFVQSQDYQLITRLGREHELANLPLVLAAKRTHPGQTTRIHERQNEFKRRVIGDLLKEIGVRCSDAELTAHYHMTRGDLSNIPELPEAADWLRLLLKCNDESRRLPAEQLTVVAAQVWLQLCWRRRAAPARAILGALGESPMRRAYPRALWDAMQYLPQITRARGHAQT